MIHPSKNINAAYSILSANTVYSAYFSSVYTTLYRPLLNVLLNLNNEQLVSLSFQNLMDTMIYLVYKMIAPFERMNYSGTYDNGYSAIKDFAANMVHNMNLPPFLVEPLKKCELETVQQLIVGTGTIRYKLLGSKTNRKNMMQQLVVAYALNHDKYFNADADSELRRIAHNITYNENDDHDATPNTSSIERIMVALLTDLTHIHTDDLQTKSIQFKNEWYKQLRMLNRELDKASQESICEIASEIEYYFKLAGNYPADNEVQKKTTLKPENNEQVTHSALIVQDENTNETLQENSYEQLLDLLKEILSRLEELASYTKIPINGEDNEYTAFLRSDEGILLIPKNDSLQAAIDEAIKVTKDFRDFCTNKDNKPLLPLIYAGSKTDIKAGNIKFNTNNYRVHGVRTALQNVATCTQHLLNFKRNNLFEKFCEWLLELFNPNAARFRARRGLRNEANKLELPGHII